MNYSRQELYWGKKNQTTIQKATVTIVGVGALGTFSAELLCRTGVRKLIIIDRDRIEESNLQRQILYDHDDVGKWKAEVAAEKMKKSNPNVQIEFHITDLNHHNSSLLNGIILDCTDNLSTRRLINEYCKKNKMPWIYSACIRDYGNVMSILPQGPCFNCVFGDAETNETCDTVGIVNTAVGVIASMAVTEVIKIIIGKSDSILLSYNVWSHSFSQITPKKNDACSVCNGKYEYLSGKYAQKIITYCGSNQYQFRLPRFDYNEVLRKFSSYNIKKGPSYFFVDSLAIFNDGRVVVKAENEQRAKAILSKFFGL